MEIKSTDKNIKVSLQDFYEYLKSDYKDYKIYCDHDEKRYWIIPTYLTTNLYMEFETTTLKDVKEGKIEVQDMLNELKPLIRREKINKILKDNGKN